RYADHRALHSFPTRRSSDLRQRSTSKRISRRFNVDTIGLSSIASVIRSKNAGPFLLTFDVLFESFDEYLEVWEGGSFTRDNIARSEEHTSELQSRENLVCRL